MHGNVVSLFDGMSCLQMALGEIGFIPTKYYASEVDKYAIKSTMHLFPNTIQLGDVRNIKGSDLGFVHLIGGGSPCQSFSFAGKRKGMAAFKRPIFIKPSKDEWKKYISDKNNVMFDYEDFVNFMEDQYNLRTDASFMEHIEILTLEHYLDLKSQKFEFEGQSYLFWEYMRILNELREINPNIYFLLENVEMGQKWEKILSRAIGVNGIHINSALVSAQNRKRVYWTNIGMQPMGLFGDMASIIKQPKDKKILLKDILESEVDEKYYLSTKAIEYLNRDSTGNYSDRLTFMNYDDKNKSTCITANHSKGIPYNMVTVHNTNVKKDNLVIQLNPSTESNGSQPYQQNRVYDTDGISPCLNTDGRSHAVEIKSGTLRTHNDGKGFREVVSGKGATVPARAREDGSGQNVVSIQGNIRRLTPRECGRLQTVPEHLLDKMLLSGVSDTQLYRCFGNGWTISVISHILSYLPQEFKETT